MSVLKEELANMDIRTTLACLLTDVSLNAELLPAAFAALLLAAKAAGFLY